MHNHEDQAEIMVSYTELLFDLIYVFAITQLSHYLLHHLNLPGLFQASILWFGIWLLWQHTIWVTNWFNANTAPVRLLLIIIMVVSLFMTSALQEAFNSKGILFAVCYVSIQVGRTLTVLLMVGNNHTISNNYKRMFAWMSLSGVFWLAGAFVTPSFRLWFWLMAVLLDYISPIVRYYTPGLGYSRSKKEWIINGELLLERCKLFVIIAFGETILMTGVTLSEIQIWSLEKITAVIVSFLGSVVMWWIYFEISSELTTSSIKQSEDPGSLGLAYNSIHAILVGAIIVSAVGDEMVVRNSAEPMNMMSVLLLIGGSVIYIAANMMLKWCTCRTLLRSHLLGIVLLLALIPVSFFFDTLITNIIILIIFACIAVYETHIRQRIKMISSS